MFIVLLRFAENKSRAGEFMAAHNAWLQQGFEDGVFQLAGGLAPSMGGALLALESSASELQARIDRDPFVEEGIVTPEILQIDPKRAVDRLDFLLDRS